MALTFMSRRPDSGLGNIRSSPADPSRNIDWVLLTLQGILMVAGCFVVYSASRTRIPGDPLAFADRQVVFAIVGAVSRGGNVLIPQGDTVIQAGDVFGAGALVTAEHRRYGNAKAVSDCKLLKMNREKFLFAVQESPMFAIELLGSIDQRLRQLKDCTKVG